jgi:UDP-glucose 4-epimerase
MKVLVTGGAGFIGSHLVDALVQRGENVVVVDSLITGKMDYVNPGACFYQIDVCSPELKEVFQKERPEVVFHLAAQTSVGRSVADPILDCNTNILGSLNTIINSIETGVTKLVYASSSAAYGHPSYVPVDEKHPTRPLSHYGVSKHTVEDYLAVFHTLNGLSFTALRYANVYGPRQNPLGEGGVVAIFSQKMLTAGEPAIYGDGSKTRDYICVADIVTANLAAARYTSCDVFNIGTGVATTDDTIFDLVSRSSAFRKPRVYAPERPGDIKHMCLDITKARQLLGWSPSMTLGEGIEQTVQYYRSYCYDQG